MKTRITKGWIGFIALSIFAFSFCVNEPLFAKPKVAKNNSVQNVILLIGDGMGLSYTSAYRYFKNPPMTLEMTRTAFDPYLVGTQITYPHDSKDNVTDSAAAGTAMATGVKSYNGAIAMDTKKRDLETVLERWKKRGKSTGLVVTSEVTDATPACFAAHVEERWSKDEIADHFFDRRINGNHTVDVFLGGGRSNFVRSDRNLTEAFIRDGYSYVTSREALKKDGNTKILGLFSPKKLPQMVDRTPNIPSLREMTLAALKRLTKNDQGFFLMVEGSQIDIAGHRNDIVGVMSEMTDFEKAFQAAIDFAKKDKHTLVVATADHSTGGLTVGANKVYGWDPIPIKKVKRTASFIAHEINKGKDIDNILQKYISFPLTSDEINSIKVASKENVQDTLCNIISKKSHTGWTTKGHTGDDIPVYAYGPQKELFMGVNENTNIGKRLFDLVR